MSRQRQDILKIIQESDRHLTAEEIFLRCREAGIAMSMATVYRNLGILTDQGVVKRVSIVGEPDRYDRNLSFHEHIICNRCKRIQDIHVARLMELLEEQTGIEICSYDLCMRYICPECRKKEDGQQ